MGWLADENGFWLFLAAVAGSLVTLFLTLRKATVSRPVGRSAAADTGADEAVAEPDPDPDADREPDPDEPPPMPSRRSFTPPSYDVPEIGFQSPMAGAAAREESAADEPGAPGALFEMPASGPYGAGSAEPLEGGASPGEEFTIKAKRSSMLFHGSDSPYYARTIADVWFDSEDAARSAGFTRWDDN